MYFGTICQIVAQLSSRLKAFSHWAFYSIDVGPSAFSLEPSAFGLFAAGLSAHVEREPGSIEHYDTCRFVAQSGSKLKAHSPLSFLLM
jgi:hypothetical protein